MAQFLKTNRYSKLQIQIKPIELSARIEQFETNQTEIEFGQISKPNWTRALFENVKLSSNSNTKFNKFRRTSHGRKSKTMSVTLLVAEAVWSNIESTGSGTSSLFPFPCLRHFSVEFSFFFFAVTEEQLSMSVSPNPICSYTCLIHSWDSLFFSPQRSSIFVQPFSM